MRFVKLDTWRINVNTFEDLKWAEFKITIEKIVGDYLEESMLRRYNRKQFKKFEIGGINADRRKRKRINYKNK